MKRTSHKLGLLAAAIMSMSPSMNAETAAWERLAPLPQPNGGFVAGALENRVVIAGGTTWEGDAKLWLDQIWAYDSKANRWENHGRLLAPQAYAVSGVDGGELFFAGGSSGVETNGKLYKLGKYLDLRLVGPIEPHLVYGCGAVLQGRLYMVGGAPAQDRLEATTNAAYAIELGSGATTRLPDLPVPSLFTGTAAAAGGRLFVFAGAHWNAAAGGVENGDKVFEFSPTSNEWSALKPYPFPARGVTAVALDAKNIYIGGGYKNDVEEFTTAAFVFNAETREFRPAVPMPIAAMVHLVVAEGNLYCLGGEDRKKHRTDAVFRIPVAKVLASAAK